MTKHPHKSNVIASCWHNQHSCSRCQCWNEYPENKISCHGYFHMLLAETEVLVNGTCGIIKDGTVTGYSGYEADEPAVGDRFSWVVENNTHLLITKKLPRETYLCMMYYPIK